MSLGQGDTGITRLLTLNMSDFEVFAVFHPQTLVSK
jgi:hypothetical protein